MQTTPSTAPAKRIRLSLTAASARELRAALGGIVNDLGTVDAEGEDRAALDRLSAILARLDALV